MNKKVAVLMVTLSVMLGSVGFAKDVTEKAIGPENSWQESIPLDGKNGKYNIVVTATDIAGNEEQAGPFNIFIDPNSDMPVAGITNPAVNMTVSGNLNIVGTCTDDDSVDHVNIILDGDRDNIIEAEGKDFWSYFLETKNLAEGPHTIEAYGTDINGLVGKSVTVTWNLNRNKPDTAIENPGMGTLVTGKINLTGYVKDGNGIKSLEYSLDGGLHYSPISLKPQKLSIPDADGSKVHYAFTLPIDTKRIADGPAICWFKGIDTAGSVGYFAFLFFVDNTYPEVKIITPAENEPQNGIVTVAGFAKDTNGMQKLSWEWGSESGDFELIEGNPYWTKEINITGLSKPQVFKVTAVDTMGNVVTVSRTIACDPSVSKPVVSVKYPINGIEVEGVDGTMYMRGIATDEDGIASIFYKIDNEEERTFKAEGVFYQNIPGGLTSGAHSLTVYAVDQFGIKGDPVTVNFTSKGVGPVFNSATLKSGKSTVVYENAMEINPDANYTFDLPISSNTPLASVEYTLAWGEGENRTQSLALTGTEKKATVAIPLFGDDIPWGISTLHVTAKDTFDRVAEYSTILNIRDLTKSNTDKPGVYFVDSTVSSEGKIAYREGVSVTGYMAGSKAASVSLIPSTPAVTATLSGNSIVLKATAATAPFTVRVITQNGAAYDSQSLQFVAPAAAPVIAISDASEETGVPVDFSSDTSLTITGSVNNPSKTSVVYRVFAAEATIVDGIVKTSKALPATSLAEATPVVLDAAGKFTIKGSVEDSEEEGTIKFVDGFSVVEIIATNEDGLVSTKAVFVNNTPAKRIALEEGEVIPPSDTPKPYLFEGEASWYGVCVYQGSVDQLFKVYKKADLKAGPGTVDFTVQATDVEKATPAKASAKTNKKGSLSARFSSAYKSGMDVENTGTLSVLVEFNADSVTGEWSTVGKDFSGATIKKSDKAVVETFTLDSGDTINTINIPLSGLPSGYGEIILNLTDSTGQKFELKGNVNIIRNHDLVDSVEKLYLKAVDGAEYNSATNTYKLDGGAYLSAFANIQSDYTVAFVKNVNGLSLETEGKITKVKVNVDGNYNNVQLKMTDVNGGTYTTPAFNVSADAAPTITLTSPVNMGWTKETLVLKGKVTDGSGVASFAYCIFDEKLPQTITEPGPVNEDGTPGEPIVKQIYEEPTWIPVSVGRDGSFSVNVDLKEYEDGYIPLNLRAVDNTGKINVQRYAVQKDTVAPEVTVLLPDAGAKINGENLILFSVKDSGPVKAVNFNSGLGIRKTYDIGDKSVILQNVGIEPNAENTEATMNQKLPKGIFGSEELPIDNSMQFTFVDAAGNETVVSDWKFSVDAASDLPVTEIHMPEDNDVITKDFTISGIVYDDDGPCLIWYKIDNGEYRLVSEEYSSSYKINVPLSAMTDNEHTVTVVAEDSRGTRGEEVVRRFRISLEEPKGKILTPKIDESVTGFVTVTGTASDKNGISKVQVSIDNGNTFNEAEGGENWSYKFDSNVLQDGTHVIFLKIVDGYGISALYSSLLNVDNTAPVVSLELPLDDSETNGMLYFSGQTTDNIELRKLYITIRSFDSKNPVPAKFQNIEVAPDKIISEQLDISELQNGFYNIELTGVDAAENTSRVSRNIKLDKALPHTKVSVLYPLNNQNVQSEFNIFGNVTSDEKVVGVELYIDDQHIPGFFGTDISEDGYFKFHLENEIKQKAKKIKNEDGTVTELESEKYILEEGRHTYKIVAKTESGQNISSNEQTFIYSAYGPWVTLDNFTYGDFADNRPMLKGNAGYTMSAEDKAALKNKDTPTEIKNNLAGKKIERVYLSFDNGRSFIPVSKSGQGKWEYRIEDQDLAEGSHFMLIKAEMVNGEVAVTRNIVKIDHQKPGIKLISPGEGGRYNQELEFSGLTNDDIRLKDVKISLRKGDKAGYGVPNFIQGLYFDASVWGATLYSVGIGLTAFDNAVKIQGNFGQFTKEQWAWVAGLLGQEATNYRFGGDVFGAKIIAQIGYLPFNAMFGHDFDWLAASFAVGANFSWFSDSGAVDSTTGETVSQFLTAALVQIEFPQITFKNWKVLKTWSTYIEPQIWFIPSDVASENAKKYVFTLSMGGRVKVF